MDPKKEKDLPDPEVPNQDWEEAQENFDDFLQILSDRLREHDMEQGGRS